MWPSLLPQRVSFKGGIPVGMMVLAALHPCGHSITNHSPIIARWQLRMRRLLHRSSIGSRHASGSSFIARNGDNISALARRLAFSLKVRWSPCIDAPNEIQLP
jgi:hypothetical protein